jgi:hypothetical protein
MNISEVVKKKFKRRWTLKREMKKQEELLEVGDPIDPAYTATLDSIQKCTEIRSKRAETRAKVFQAVGTVGLGLAALFAAYSMDKSDNILQHKQSLNVFNKIFKG